MIFFMKNIHVRKIIALSSMATVIFVLVYSVITKTEITDSSHGLLTILTGYIGYYFGKSTALDRPDKDDYKEQIRYVEKEVEEEPQ